MSLSNAFTVLQMRMVYYKIPSESKFCFLIFFIFIVVFSSLCEFSDHKHIHWGVVSPGPISDALARADSSYSILVVLISMLSSFLLRLGQFSILNFTNEASLRAYCRGVEAHWESVGLTTRLRVCDPGWDTREVFLLLAKYLKFSSRSGLLGEVFGIRIVLGISSNLTDEYFL